jgi:hypothetical protein
MRLLRWVWAVCIALLFATFPFAAVARAEPRLTQWGLARVDKPQVRARLPARGVVEILNQRGDRCRVDAYDAALPNDAPFEVHANNSRPIEVRSAVDPRPFAAVAVSQHVLALLSPDTSCGYDAPHLLRVSRTAVATNTPKPGVAVRPVGSVLESVDDVVTNPQLLAGKTPAQVRAVLSDTPSWVEGTLNKGRSAGSGWTFREVNSAGTDYTGRYIQWSPGSPRHYGGQPY